MTITQEFLARTESLKQSYTFVRPNQVEAYLEQYPFLISVLQTAPAKIHQYFPDAPLLLEVTFYQDGLEGECDLFLRIVPKTEPEEAVKMFEQLDHLWWDPIASIAQGKMELSIT